MGQAYESPNARAYIVGLGVPDRVSQLVDRLVKDLIGIGGEAGIGMYRYSDADGEKSEKSGEKRVGRSEVTTWPMEPMVPILISFERPKTPVTGLLPPCESVIEIGKNLILHRPSRWITLPVNSSGWFGNLRQKLESCLQEQEKQAAMHVDDSMLPLCLGLPLLCIDEYKKESFPKAPELSIDEVLGWRALPLICWEVEYLPHRPWHHSVYWTPIWKRRLRRAMSIFNRDEDIV